MASLAGGLHEALASLLDYPVTGYAARIALAAERLAAEAPAAASALAPFVRWASERTAEDAEEAFTRAFDSNAECALEVGWHAYGETYQRGVFLVQMRSLLAETGVEEGTELPDHLPLLLRGLGRAERSRAARLERLTVLPALRKIELELARKESPFRFVIAAVAAALTLAADPAAAPGSLA